MFNYDSYLAAQVEDYLTSGTYPDCDEDCKNCECTRCTHAKEEYTEYIAENECDYVRENS